MAEGASVGGLFQAALATRALAPIGRHMTARKTWTLAGFLKSGRGFGLALLFTRWADTSRREKVGSCYARRRAYRQAFALQDKIRHSPRADYVCKPNRDLAASGRSSCQRVNPSNSSHRVAHSIALTLCQFGR